MRMRWSAGMLSWWAGVLVCALVFPTAGFGQAKKDKEKAAPVAEKKEKAAPEKVAAPQIVREKGKDKDEFMPASVDDIGGKGDAESEEVGAGDQKVFSVITKDDIRSLQVGDIYKNEDSAFKITAIKRQSEKGGKFEATRIGGKTDPQRKWKRFSGTGPISITSRYSLLDLYVQGGMFLHPIAVLFLVTLILTVNNIILYRRRRHCPARFVSQAEEALIAGDMKKFEDLALKNTGLMAFICRAMVDRFDTSSMDDILYRIEVTTSRQIGRLRVPVKALNLISVAAPLLGLLGTIVGMVIVFEGVAGATGTAKATQLAAGIRVKLFSTASAMMVAIPALFLFFIFNQKLNGIISECEIVAERFLHLLTLQKRRSAAAGGGTEQPARARQSIGGSGESAQW